MKISMIGFLVLGVAAASACAMAAAPVAPAAGPVAPPEAKPPVMGPVLSVPINQVTRDALQMLHDRKNSLKDFTADIEYNVDDPRGGATGKLGEVSYIMDTVLGPTFSVDFTDRTVNGVPKLKLHAQVIFDGKIMTEKDWGANGNSKTFFRRTLVKPGDKPGSAVTLGGPLPLPIGVEVSEVVASFDVTQKASKDANLVVLQLVPHAGTSFDYRQLVMTIDMKQQLPVKLEETMGDKSVTTITFTDVHINEGKAKMLDVHTPKAEGWAPKPDSEPAEPPG